MLERRIGKQMEIMLTSWPWTWPWRGS